jgi:hypothetical protein
MSDAEERDKWCTLKQGLVTANPSKKVYLLVTPLYPGFHSSSGVRASSLA